MNDSNDFLAFSSSTPRSDERFQPRRGKKNRQGNWQRFGQFEQRGGYNNSPRFYSPQNSRGSPGDFLLCF